LSINRLIPRGLEGEEEKKEEEKEEEEKEEEEKEEEEKEEMGWVEQRADFILVRFVERRNSAPGHAVNHIRPSASVNPE